MKSIFSRKCITPLVLLGVLGLFQSSCSVTEDSGVLDEHFTQAPEIPLKGSTRLKASDLPKDQRVVRLGVPSPVSVEITHQRYKVVVATMEKVLAIDIELQVTETYEDLLDAMATGRVDLAVFSPKLYVLAQEKIPKLQPIVTQVALGVPFYSSFILVRGDDPARKLEDLVGRKVAFVSEGSASGFLFPYAAFLDAGLDPEEDFSEVKFAGDHFKAIQMLRFGEVDVIGTGSGMRRSALRAAGEVNPVTDSGLRVLAKAGRIPFDVLCASPKFPQSGVGKIKKAMMRMHARTADGKTIWRATDKISAWIPYIDERYEVIRTVHKRVNEHRVKAREDGP
jgi:phosphonate transport system substrate-binding protein